MQASFSRRRPRPVASRPRGFTLIEILIVVTILVLLMSLSLTGITSSLQSQRLSASATRLAGELSAAALQAIRENREIQARLLRQDSGPGVTSRLRGIQLHAITPATGATIPVSEPLLFDADVMIYEDPAFSSLLSHQTASLPDGYLTLRPNGSTDLSKTAAARWSLTLVLEGDLQASGGALPPNYRTLVINPHTAAIRLY